MLRSGAESGSGSRELLFEWNRTDLSQFVSGGAADFSDGGATRALTVVGVAERGNVLRYSGGSGGATITQIFMLKASSGALIPSTTERRDVDIEIELYASTGAYHGVFVLGDLDTPLHGFGHCNSLIEWQTLLNNGAVERDGGTGGGTEVAAHFRIRGRKPAGAPPEVSSYFNGWNTSAGGVGDMRRSGSSAAARGDFGGSPAGNFGTGSSALGATWNNISADRIGLIFQSSGGNPAPTQVDILDLRVYRP